jgi:spermidine/putrescine-binding protein
MSWTMYNNIRQHRIEKSLAAYDKYVAKSGEPTDEEMRKLFDRFEELEEKNVRLYWWAVKVYNGWCIVKKKSPIWV